ncbi:MAG TPA: Ala-tRNA(Pro) hydrolase, partial [Chloroflexi bacterium]|nr:Ala-tRNA(Pro) hydrolase [Chloroflexota bacterium]
HGSLVQAAHRWRVTGLQRQGDQLVHLLEGAERPEPGSQVHGELDWERRYRLMRTHTAMHILCGVIWRDYGAQVTGGNMEPGRGRMDFEFERMQKELVQEIEERVNTEVAAERDIVVRILPREEAFQIPDLIRTKINLLPEGITAVRTVEIKGLDLQADGGTHVANTREVGRIRVTNYKSKGKINKRIEIAIGE